MTKPAAAPSKWTGLVGEYGWDHDVLYILEREGKLHALIEWFYLYPLEEVAPDRYAFPRSGLYDGEQLRFIRPRPDAPATAADLEGLRFPRRPVGVTEETFRITPLKPVAELRALASAGAPPVETGKRAPDLVELSTLDPTIKYDIRYATTNNFMSTAFYSQSRALMQRPAAEAAVRAHRALKAHGYGLLIHDAYRPWAVTKMFWDATPEPQRVFVADPSQGSRHNRGCAVDLTLYDLATGQPVPMVGGYDEFSDRSYPDYPGGTSLQRWHRELLRRIDGSRELHGLRGRVVALRLQQLAGLPDPEPTVREASKPPGLLSPCRIGLEEQDGRQDESGCDQHPRRQRLSRECPSEQHGNHRVDVGMGRDEGGRATLEQPRVGREGDDRAEDDQIPQPEK